MFAVLIIGFVFRMIFLVSNVHAHTHVGPNFHCNFFSFSLFYFYFLWFLLFVSCFFPIPFSPPFFSNLSFEYLYIIFLSILFAIFVQPLQIFLLKPCDFRRTISAFGIYCEACLKKVGSAAARELWRV